MESKLVKVVTRIINFIYVLRFCVAFTLVYEVFSKVLTLKHELKFHGGSDPKMYLIAYAVAGILAMLGDIALALSHLIFKSRNRKRLLLHILALHIIILVPVGGAGVYLALKERDGTPEYTWAGKYEHLAEHFPNSEMNGTEVLWNMTERASELDGVVSTLKDVQTQFGCCLSGNNETDVLFIEFDLQPLSNCTVPNATRPDGMRWGRLKGCHERFTGIWRSLLMLTSCSLTVASVIFILISPAIYTIFEYDARRERFQSILLWQKKTRKVLEEERKEPRELTAVDDEEDQLLSPVSSL